MSWGAYVDRQRVGLSWSRNRDPSQANPSVVLTADVLQQTSYSSFNYDGTVNWSGDMGSGSHTGRLSGSSVYTHATLSKTYTASYSGTIAVDATVRGTSDGTSGTATVSDTVYIPRRPTANPTAPGTPSVVGLTSSTVELSWAAPSDMKGTTVDYYRVEVSTNSSFTNIVKNPTTTSRSITITGLDRSKTYYVRVRLAANGWDSNRTSPNSGTRSFKTLAEPPVLSNYSAYSISRSAATCGNVAISDNGGESPSNLRVQYNTSQSATGATVKTKGSWAAIQLTGLAPATTYYFRMAGYNSAGWGAYGPWRSFTTLSTSPSEPAPPVISAITDTGFVATWTAPALNGATLTGYTLVISDTDDPDTPVKTYNHGPDTLTRTVTGLTKAHDYQVYVRANATPASSGYSDAAPARTTGTLSTLFPFINIGPGGWRPFQLFAYDEADTPQRVALALNVGGVWKKEVL